MIRLFSISETSKRTGMSAYTLRYYEKMGLLPSPKRNKSGSRFYTEADIQFITFLKSLRETGMSLEDMNEFVKDGCILENLNALMEMSHITPSIHKRIEILTKHLVNMEMKKSELEKVISATKLKLDTYDSLLKEDVGD